MTHALDLFPVVVVTGARQTGKSTLVKALPTASVRCYLTLDTAVSRGLAAAEPHALLDAGDASPLTLDEVQRAAATPRLRCCRPAATSTPIVRKSVPYTQTYLERDLRDLAAIGNLLLLHGGDQTFWLSEGVLVAPWWKVI